MSDANLFDLIIHDARLADGQRLDIGMRAGAITALAPAHTLSLAVESLDAGGNVLLPGLVDAHVHLDKTYAPMPNVSGTLREAVDVWQANRINLTKADARVRAARAIEQAIANGATAMRTHVNTLDPMDLPLVEAILELREVYRDALTLQLVALGLPGDSPGRDDVIESALRMGVDIVGNAPSFASDVRRSTQAAFALAEKTGKPLDLHLDENDNPDSRELEHAAELTLALGMQGRVVAGHCCSLSFMTNSDAGRIMDRVARAGMHVITLPSCNLVLQGRERWPAPRGVTRVKELLARGVNVCAATDNVRDPFPPFGAYDALMAAHMCAHGAHMCGLDELAETRAMVTRRPRAAMGLPAVDVTVGALADLVLLDSSDVLDAVLCPPLRLATIKAGRLVYRAEIKREWRVRQGASS